MENNAECPLTEKEIAEEVEYLALVIEKYKEKTKNEEPSIENAYTLASAIKRLKQLTSDNIK